MSQKLSGKIQKHYREILLGLTIMAFIIFKIPHLSLPYFSDEAFAFGPAIHKMYEDGVGLLPSALPPDYSFGHPLLFHFCAAGWMKIFGDTQAGAKSFPLFLSVILIISLYHIIRDFFNKDAALLAVVLLMLQPVFLTQSSFLLLEVMVTLLGLWTIYFWFKRKWWWYGLFASMLVMTKESGLFLVFALGVWQLIEFAIIKNERFSWKLFFRRFLILLVPAWVFGIFLIIQKLTYGWFFYPLRVKDLRTDLDSLKHFSWWTRKIIYYWHGRGYVTLSLLISLLAYYFLPGKRFSLKQWNILWFLFAFMLIYQYISIFNFISNRYFLIVNAALIILSAAVFVQAFGKFRWLVYPLAALLIFSQAWHANERSYSGDDCLGGIDMIRVHQQTVNFLEEHDLYGERLFTHYLMIKNLHLPVCGYLSSDRIFNNITGDPDGNFDWAVISRLELTPQIDSLRHSDSLELVRRFEQGHSWAEVYRKKSIKKQ